MNTSTSNYSSRHYFTWDWLCIVCTILVNLIFIWTFRWLFVGDPSWPIFVVPAILIGLAILFALALCPIYVERTGDVLRVKCLLYSRSFELSTCTLTALEQMPLKGMIRTFGSGGYFGYTGYFHSPTLGNFFCLATHRKRPCLLIRNAANRQTLINCPHELVADFISPQS